MAHRVRPHEPFARYWRARLCIICASQTPLAGSSNRAKRGFGVRSAWMCYLIAELSMRKAARLAIEERQ